MSIDEPNQLQSLAEREARLAEAEAVAHMGSWVWHVDTNEVFWSDELFRILGLEKGKVSASAEAFFKAIHPEDLPGLQADSARIAETGESITRSGVRIVRPDGEVRTIRMTNKQVAGEDGSALRIVGTVLDMTDALAKEAELDRTLTKLRQAQRLANVGSWIWDRRDDSVEWTEQMFRIAELDPETFKPSVEGFFRLVHPEDVPMANQAMQNSMAGTPAPLHCRLVLANGDIRHVEIESSVELYEDGEPAVIMGTMLDQTERKSLEAQLRQSQKMEALGKLAGGVARDLNNYLQIVTGNIELLERDDPRRDTETRQARQDVRTSLQLCSSLTQGLLAFSRRQTVEPRPIDLHEAVSGSLSLVGQLLGKNIRTETLLQAERSTVYCDPHQIEQIIFNLAINARDAMQEGGTLKVSSEVIDAPDLAVPGGFAGPGTAIRVVVRDTGVGMSEEVRARVFDPFFTTKPKGRSTGLGLAIVYGIVQQNQGRIAVESERGEGTRFLLDFPLIDAEVRAPDSRPGDKEGSGERTQRILVAEDDRMVRRVTAIMLRKAGYEVVEVADGQEAVDHLAQEDREAIDLVISDVMMPRLTGVELVEKLGGKKPTPPVLLMTGYAEQELVEMGPASEQPILFKPFPRADLLRAVTDMLGD